MVGREHAVPGDFRIEGRQVAQIGLRRSSSALEHVVVFRGPRSWTVLSIARTERYDDDGTLAWASAAVSSTELADLAALREFCERRDCWREVIEAGQHEDPDLYRAGVPHRVDADLDGASIYNQDLALVTTYLGGEPVPSPARALPRWEAGACADMAAHLDERGWLVRGPATPTPAASQPGGNVVVGALEAWRYGWAVAIVVRVDDCGEVYARRADDDEVVSTRGLRALSGDEEDLADAEYRRRRAHGITEPGPTHDGGPPDRRRAPGR